MRGLKHLSTLFIVVSTLMFMGSASAQASDLEVSNNYTFNNAQSVGMGSETVIYADGGDILVEDTDGNQLETTTYNNDVQASDVSKSDGVYAYSIYDGTQSTIMIRDIEGSQILFEQTYDGSISDQAFQIHKGKLLTGTVGSSSKFLAIDLNNTTVEKSMTTGNIGSLDTESDYVYWIGDSLKKYRISDYTQVNSLSIAGNHNLAVTQDHVAEMHDEGDQITIYDTNLNHLRDITISSTKNALFHGGGEFAVANSGYLDFYNATTKTQTTSLNITSNSIETVDYQDGGIFAASSTEGTLYGDFYDLPESTTVTEESTNMLTGNFALSASAGIVSAAKGIGAITAGLATWELGVEDWLFGTNDADKELWKSDIRANAVTIEDQRMNILNASELSEDALFGDAMASAKAQGLQAFNNGSTTEEAKTAVETTVEDYYSDVERTVVNGYNNEILNLQNDKNNAEAAGADFSTVFKRDFESLAIVNTTYTLPNGEELPTYYVVDDSGTKIYDINSGDGVGLTTTSGDNYSSAEYLDGGAHYDVIQGVRDTRSNAITNVNEIVDNIYNNYEQGQINVSDQLNALELTESLSTAYSETGSYNYAAASLARTGQPTDLDSAFNITYQNETMEGALFASNAVVGDTVEAGKTYNGADGNAVFVKQAEDSASLVELKDQFTVNSIKSLEDGSRLNSTKLQAEQAYQQDIGDLEAELNSLQKQLEETNSILGGGGLTGGSGSLFGGNSAVGGMIVVALLILVGAGLA